MTNTESHNLSTPYDLKRMSAGRGVSPLLDSLCLPACCCCCCASHCKPSQGLGCGWKLNFYSRRIKERRFHTISIGINMLKTGVDACVLAPTGDFGCLLSPVEVIVGTRLAAAAVCG